MPDHSGEMEPVSVEYTSRELFFSFSPVETKGYAIVRSAQVQYGSGLSGAFKQVQGRQDTLALLFVVPRRA